MPVTATITNDVARRMALAAQGFHDGRAQGRVDARHYRRVLKRIGLVQLDSVNVVCRAHYLPFWTRLGAYDRAALDGWAHDGHELFEYWAHAASLVPSDLLPLLRWRMAQMGPWPGIERLEAEAPGYIDGIYEEIATRGPLRVGQVRDAGERQGSWWGYGKGKMALEWLFATGRITAIRDGNFHRLYDLPERLLPKSALAQPAFEPAAAKRGLLMRAVRHLGIGTAADIADYYRLGTARGKPLLDEMANDGVIESVNVTGWKEPAYRDPGAVVPRHIGATALVSPFDSLVWHRERTERLFNFHYRIEIYVPAPKRQYGYYVLPFLMAGELVGRVDLKADRHAGVLRVPGAFVEPGRDRTGVARALAEELASLAAWLDLSSIEIGERGDLAAQLGRLV